MNFDTTYANSNQQAAILDPAIEEYYRTGFLPIEKFNEQLSSGDTKSESVVCDKNLFGTHLREAIDILVGRANHEDDQS